MELKRIFLPTPNPENEYVCYENQLQPRMVFGDTHLEALFEVHETEIMDIVEQAITEYVNCEDLCNDTEGMFPCRSALTGEWYLRNIDFTEEEYLSIYTAFLSEETGKKDDYLGLEVCLFFNEDSENFELDTVNSDCI